MAAQTTEGTIPFTVDGETFQTWYKVVGDLSNAISSGHPPLIALHGGPGCSHDYLLPLADVVPSTSPAVIFYDQIGTARSTHLPHKPETFWSIDLFVRELENLVAYFGLQDCPFDLYGHSWGGVLALAYAIRRKPKSPRRLILANTYADSATFIAERLRLIGQLPEDARKVLAVSVDVLEEDWAPYSEEEKAAWLTFYSTYACVLDPVPSELLFSIGQSMDVGGGGKVLNGMRKNHLEHNWDIRSQLHLLKVPTLLVNGEHDYMTDIVVGPFFKLIEKVKWVKFAASSHTPQWEERERFLEVLGDFLRYA